MILRVQFCILASCCLSPMRRNSVLEMFELGDLQSSRRRCVVKHYEKIRWIEREKN